MNSCVSGLSCGRAQSSGDGGAVAEEFVSACLASTNLDEEMCTCVAGKAKERLSDNGYTLVLANLLDDPARAEKARASLSFQDAVDAGLFMVNAPADCAAERAPTGE